MPPPNRQNQTPPARSWLSWPVVAVTLLVGAVAVCLAWPQVFPGPDQANDITLPNLNQRASGLRQISDPVERDRFCVPLSAYGRALDRALPPDVRVFLSGMIGKANGPRLGYYYFLRNYLFPRDVEISLDGKAIFHVDGFEGVPCDSPEVLRTNGFDLLLLMPTNSDNIQIIPLTQKGVPK
jgi:hypothetical protein